MKSLIVFAALFIAVVSSSKIVKFPHTTIEKLEDLDPRIIGGQYASLGQFPWQVAINITTDQGTNFCGGSLIDKLWVLTAAHCTPGGTAYSISMGSIYRGQLNEPGSIVVTTQTAIVHEQYDPLTLNNDIALLKLENSVTFTNKINKIALADSKDYLRDGVVVTVSGWGRTSNSGSISPTLKYANMTTISNAVCKAYYGAIITNATLCATNSRAETPCNGDSGGPLTTTANGKIVHAGIVSFVSSAGCTAGYPSGYVRTASYRDWIDEHTGGGNGGGNGGCSGNCNNNSNNNNNVYFQFFWIGGGNSGGSGNGPSSLLHNTYALHFIIIIASLLVL